MDNLEKFINDFLDDKLTPHVKSEDIPETQGAVKVFIIHVCFPYYKLQIHVVD
jgi:hypothetical protein